MESKRMVEARAIIKQTRKKMDENTNMKRDVKTVILECMDIMVKLLKESKEEKERTQDEVTDTEVVRGMGKDLENKEEVREIIKVIEDHSQLLRESKEEIVMLKEALGKNQELVKGSYASVAAGPPRVKLVGGTAVHSVVINSTDDQETSDQVLEKIRKVVNAREEGIKIDNIRKAKEGKVIIGCGSREELGRIKEKIKTAGKNLCVKEMENNDPLIVLKEVMKYNKDEEVIQGLRKQNRHLFQGLTKEEDKVVVKYRKRTRNLLTEHIVLKVSPKLWCRLTDAGKVHIDLQKVHVADHSPLIQCARCLGYGHSKRFCRDAVDVCSHCGGSHLRSECTALAEGSLPRCVNCVGAKLDRTDHNAFSDDCPVRRRWDVLARSTVQYS